MSEGISVCGGKLVTRPGPLPIEEQVPFWRFSVLGACHRYPLALAMTALASLKNLNRTPPPASWMPFKPLSMMASGRTTWCQRWSALTALEEP